MLPDFASVPGQIRASGRSRPGATYGLVLGTLAAIFLGIVAAAFLALSGTEDKTADLLLHTVQRGRFLHDVVERGEVESSSNVEIRCEVESKNSSGTAILEVLEEGTRVQADDVLVRLDSSALEQEYVQQRIVVNTAEATLIQTENELSTAKIAKTEYEEGTFRQEEQLIQSELFVAEENLRRAQQYLQYSERLAAKGYVTALQLEGDRFAVEKAQNEVDTARTKLRVLQEYTKQKTLLTLESDIRTGEAKWKAEQESYQLETTKLKDIKEQIAKCVIHAPQAGTVVYANKESRRSGTEFVVEPGSLVLERQIIIRLPDPRYMQVKAEINESRVTLIKTGMKVTIRLDAFEDEILTGEVVKVNEYPEPGSWFSSQIKEYATFVKIDDPPALIRPGLTAEVRIHVDQREDALQVPVQAIHEHGDKLYCMLHQGDEWKAQEVEIEASNDKFVLIQTGLQEEDQVAMNPRGLLDIVRLPKIVEKPRESVASRQPHAAPAGPSPPDRPAVSQSRPEGQPAPSRPGDDRASPEAPSRSVFSDAAGPSKEGDRDRPATISQPPSQRSESVSGVDGRSVDTDAAAAVARDKTVSDPRKNDTSGGALP